MFAHGSWWKALKPSTSLTFVDFGFRNECKSTLSIWLIDIACCIMVEALFECFTWISATVFGLYQLSLNRPQNHTIEQWTAEHWLCLILSNMQSARILYARKRYIRTKSWLLIFIVCGYGLLYGLCRSMKEIGYHLFRSEIKDLIFIRLYTSYFKVIVGLR